MKRDQFSKMMYSLYEERYPIFKEFQKATAAPIINDASKNPDKPYHVLEIGTGTGATTLEILVQPNVYVTSVDIDKKIQKIAKKRLSAFESRLNLVNEDISSYLLHHMLSSSKMPVDAIVSCYTLHNFENGYRREVLEKIKLVLYPNGLFVNGDAYVMDNHTKHAIALNWTFEQHLKMYKDYPEEALKWNLHKAEDDKSGVRWPLNQAIKDITHAGFEGVRKVYQARMPKNNFFNLLESVIVARKGAL